MSKTFSNWQASIDQITSIKNLEELDALELTLLGRKKGLLTLAMRDLANSSPEEKKQQGKELNEWKNKITAALEQKRASFTEDKIKTLAEQDTIDYTLTLPRTKEQGHLHLIPEFMRQVEEVFGRMGFDVARGNEVESEEYNFTKLNIPENHPARDMQDTFWIEGKKGYVLRTQTSPVQIHYMQSHTAPFRMICPGKVYRKDSDATHSPMFHQFEGLMVGEDISLANMKAIMTAGFRELIGRDVEFRYRTAFFPFVEPGLEVDMKMENADGTSKWLEVVGCGMVHPEVLKHGGVDSKKYRGFAFGFGIERLIMIKHGITDLRAFYESDLRFLGQF